ncbi:MAG: HAD-IIIA family hydrolase [candidate division WOR-3 bacterium]
MKAIIFDRDGTIIENSHYPKYPWQIKLKKGIKEKMLKFYKTYEFFLISNQSGIKRGYYSLINLMEIHRHLENLIYPIKFREVFYCIHHPNENCPCRKPKCYFLKKIIYKYRIEIENSIIVGDSTVDSQLAKCYNLKFIHIEDFIGKF